MNWISWFLNFLVLTCELNFLNDRLLGSWIVHVHHISFLNCFIRYDLSLMLFYMYSAYSLCFRDLTFSTLLFGKSEVNFFLKLLVHCDEFVWNCVNMLCFLAPYSFRVYFGFWQKRVIVLLSNKYSMSLIRQVRNGL